MHVCYGEYPETTYNGKWSLNWDLMDWEDFMDMNCTVNGIRRYCDVCGQTTCKCSDKKKGPAGCAKTALREAGEVEREETEEEVEERGEGREKKDSKHDNGELSEGAGGGRQRKIKEENIVVPIKDKKKRTPPKVAIVSLTALDGKYDEALLKAQQKVTPEQHGINNMRVKRGLTGGYLFEITGSEGPAKADAFANSLQEVFQGSNVKTSRPILKMEVRIRRLIDSTKTEDVVNAIAQTYACRLADISTGVIRKAPNGLGDLWVRLPLEVGERLLKEARLKVGWTLATVVRLEPRHFARDCEARASCFACKERGLPTGHRMSGPFVSPNIEKGEEEDGRPTGPWSRCKRTGQVESSPIQQEETPMDVAPLDVVHVTPEVTMTPVSIRKRKISQTEDPLEGTSKEPPDAPDWAPEGTGVSFNIEADQTGKIRC
ncbi:hypothetical protein DMN91_012975 [Ooceraea biroi]|uniref:Uncharacterized protein n=1 Tax=Ooceraea biroi TaxID=2015173 RepID=A0A3L8D5G5_OOCBI|nr:hypothetical protein DMN91_012975 [Ooceraea biroi]